MGVCEQGDRTKVVLTQRFPVENLRKIVLQGAMESLTSSNVCWSLAV